MFVEVSWYKSLLGIPRTAPAGCDPGDSRVPRPAFAGATDRLSSGTFVLSP
jgi:hypothetical protein